MAEMFEPLTDKEIGAVPPPGDASASKRPIVPVPDDAPSMNFRHPEYGEPARSWAYHQSDGGLVGYACRWDIETDDGPSKIIRPVSYCELQDGRRAWRAVRVRAPANRGS